MLTLQKNERSTKAIMVPKITPEASITADPMMALLSHVKPFLNRVLLLPDVATIIPLPTIESTITVPLNPITKSKMILMR